MGTTTVPGFAAAACILTASRVKATSERVEAARILRMVFSPENFVQGKHSARRWMLGIEGAGKR